jgi:hypothetical protein
MLTNELKEAFNIHMRRSQDESFTIFDELSGREIRVKKELLLKRCTACDELVSPALMSKHCADSGDTPHLALEVMTS